MSSILNKKLKILRNYILRHPIWCTWQVTYRCNFKCNFCNYWKEQIDPAEEVSLSDIEKTSELLSNIGSLLISIAGGEPFIRKDINDIIRIIAKKHIPLITTNGWLVTPQKAKQAYQAGLLGVSVSIDYFDSQAHDRDRGVKGAHQRAVKALQYFSENKAHSSQRLNLMTVLRNNNISHIENLIKLAAKYGAYFMIQPYSAMKTGERGFMHKENISSYLIKLQNKYKNFLSNPVFLSKFDHAREKGISKCMAGKVFFNIDNYLNVSKCVEFRNKPIGKITAFTNSTNLLKSLRQESINNKCRGCWYNCRGEIESLYSIKGFFSSLKKLS